MEGTDGGELHVLVAQLCPTLWYPIDSSLPGSSVHGIPQARILGGIAIPFSRGSSQPRNQTWVSCITGRFFTVWATRKADRILEWVATLSSWGSSGARDWNCVSYIYLHWRAGSLPLAPPRKPQSCMKWKWKCHLLSRVQLFATPWTAACHASQSLGFSRQEYWNG